VRGVGYGHHHLGGDDEVSVTTRISHSEAQ
jgi:hypothetical protein